MFARHFAKEDQLQSSPGAVHLSQSDGRERGKAYLGSTHQVGFGQWGCAPAPIVDREY